MFTVVVSPLQLTSLVPATKPLASVMSEALVDAPTPKTKSKETVPLIDMSLGE